MNWKKLGGVAALALTMVALGCAAGSGKLPPEVAGAAAGVAVMLAGALRSYLPPATAPKDGAS